MAPVAVRALLGVLGMLGRVAAAAAAASASPVLAVGTTVFSFNEGGWPCTRIPSIILTGGDTLLAFAECRDRTGDGCVPEKPLTQTQPACVCMKRSRTNGSSWDAAPRCVAPPGSDQPLGTALRTAIFH